MNWWDMIKSERNRLNRYERPHYDRIMEIIDLLEEGELRTTLIDAISKWTKGSNGIYMQVGPVVNLQSGGFRTVGIVDKQLLSDLELRRYELLHRLIESGEYEDDREAIKEYRKLVTKAGAILMDGEGNSGLQENFSYFITVTKKDEGYTDKMEFKINGFVARPINPSKYIADIKRVIE
jgi:hypothetical protein